MNQKAIWCTLLGIGLFNQAWGTHALNANAVEQGRAIRAIIKTPIFNTFHAQVALKTVRCNSDDQYAQDILCISNSLALLIADDIATSMSSISGCDDIFKYRLGLALKNKLLTLASKSLVSFFVPVDESAEELSFLIREARILRTDSLENVIADSYKLGYSLQRTLREKGVDIFFNITTDLERLMPGCCVLLSKQISILAQDSAVRHSQMIGNILGNVMASTISQALFSDDHAPLNPESIGKAKRYNLTTIQVLDAIRVIKHGIPIKYDGEDSLIEPYIQQIDDLIQRSELCWEDRHTCCRICSEWIYLMRKLYMDNIDPDQCDTNKLMQDIISNQNIMVSRELFESLLPMREIAKQLMEIDKPMFL